MVVALGRVGGGARVTASEGEWPRHVQQPPGAHHLEDVVQVCKHLHHLQRRDPHTLTHTHTHERLRPRQQSTHHTPVIIRRQHAAVIRASRGSMRFARVVWFRVGFSFVRRASTETFRERRRGKNDREGALFSFRAVESDDAAVNEKKRKSAA